MYVAPLTPALQMWKSHVLEWTISDFLTDFVLQNSGLNKIVLVGGNHWFLQHHHASSSSMTLSCKNLYGFWIWIYAMQCYAPCAILSDRTFFLQRLRCVGFEWMICIFAACANIRTFVMWKLEWVFNTSALVQICNIRIWFKGGNLVHTLSLENAMVVFMESGKPACTKLGLL